MKKIVVFILLVSTVSWGQELKIKNNESGLFSLGIRSTASVFDDHDYGASGFGYGGQFRLQFSDRVNTEWYLDYLTGNLGDFANRIDYHIGWSVMFYPMPNLKAKLKPYIIMGHCFDRTELYENADRSNSVVKGSSAIQTGLGLHYNLTSRIDLTLVGQYMFHLGNDVHASLDADVVHFDVQKGAGLEGHYLFNLSFNYKIADLWGK